MKCFEYAVVSDWWNGIRPLIYGSEHCTPGHHCGPRWATRSYYLLHYIMKGSGIFRKQGVTYQVGEGDLFVICPGEQVYYEASMEDPWSYVWLGFAAQEKIPFLDQPVFRKPQVKRSFEQIGNEETSLSRYGRMFPLMYDVLWQLYEQSQSKPTNYYAAYARTYLEASYMMDISIAEIAESLHISRRYLTALFRSAYQLTPQAYLTQLRMEQSREFLKQGYSASESSAMVGILDLSNFSKQYKSYFGTCPSKQHPQKDEH